MVNMPWTMVDEDDGGGAKKRAKTTSYVSCGSCDSGRKYLCDICNLSLAAKTNYKWGTLPKLVCKECENVDRKSICPPCIVKHFGHLKPTV
jgi:hypothetical protein